MIEMTAIGDITIEQLALIDEKRHKIRNDVSTGAIGLKRGKNSGAPTIDRKEKSSTQNKPQLNKIVIPYQLRQAAIHRDDPCPIKTYSKGTSKVERKLKVFLELPLKKMVHEALETMHCFRGMRPKDIRKFIAVKYGMNFDSAIIAKAIEDGLNSGEIELAQAEPMNAGQNIYRYKLSKLSHSRIDNSRNESTPFKSLRYSVDSDQPLGQAIVDETKRMEINEVDQRSMSMENFMGATSTNARWSDTGIEPKCITENKDSLSLCETNCDSIQLDEIEFMVLHSLYSSSHTSGMSPNEIAEFISNFYGIDAQKSFPHINTYLKYAIEKGILLKNGDRYKQTFDRWKLDLEKRHSSKRVKRDAVDDNSELGRGLESNQTSLWEDFFFSDVKLEPEEEEEEIATSFEPALDCGKIGLHTNNNVIQSIDEDKKVAANITQHKYYREKKTVKKKRRKKRVALCMPRKGHSKSCKQYKIGKEVMRKIEQSNNFDISSAQFVRIEEEQIKLEEPVESIEDPAEKTVPSSREAPVKKRTKPMTIGEKLTDLLEKEKHYDFGTDATDHTDNYDVSLSQNQQELKENPAVKSTAVQHGSATLLPSETATRSASMQPTVHPVSFSPNQMAENQAKFIAEPRYTLPEINECITLYHKSLLHDQTAAKWNFGWREVSSRDNVTCLELLGSKLVSNSEDVNCNACGFELKFGASHCSFCSSEMESIYKKCIICTFICNRNDAFYNHLIWEHQAIFLRVDCIPRYVAAENNVKLMEKFVCEGRYRCGLCIYATNSVKVFESHVVGSHTIKINAFPPLPKCPAPDNVVIFHTEIEKTCCYKCGKCGFVSNGKDFMFYHILDVHFTEVDEFGEDPPPRAKSKVDNNSMKRDKSGKILYRFGLCDICGKFFNDVILHKEQHCLLIQSPDEVSPNDAEQSLLLNKFLRRREWRRLHDRNPVLCHFCGKILPGRLSQHLRIHADVMHKCKICGKHFNRRSNLYTHMRVHTREKPFECDICKMVFGYKCSVKGHILNVHSEAVK